MNIVQEEINTEVEEVLQEIVVNEQHYDNIDTLNLLDEQSKQYIDNLKEFDNIANETGMTLDQQLVLLRGDKYNSLYWGELMGYDDIEVNNMVETYNLELFTKLREEETVRINGTEFEIQTTHMYATMNCIKEGLGSLGGWKGDICELVEQLNSNDYNTCYNESIKSFESENLKFNKYDLYSDIAAVNISSMLGYNDDLSTVIENYFNKAPSINQYLMFLSIEFNIDNFSIDSIREQVKKSIKSDILVQYLIRTMNIENKDIQMEAACDAFADYICNHITVEDISKFNSMYTDSEKDKLTEVQDELKIKTQDKYLELGTRYIKENGAEKIEEFLSETKGYFSK